jgi:putative transposase
MLEFSNALVDTCQSADFTIYAWVVLPNHYHVLLKADEARTVIQTMGRMHGRTSFRWNQEENCHGRQNWFNAMETGIKSERHFWASLIYVMNNPVKHRYVDRWQDWPFSNAEEWLATMGRDDAKRIWKEFPIDDFGREWDPPDI